MSSKGIRPDPEKLRAVCQYHTTCLLKDLRSFIGLCTYFSRFISGFFDIAEPLQQLLRHDGPFTWGHRKHLSRRTKTI